MADHDADLPKFYLLFIDWLIDWEIGSVWFWKIDSLSKKAWFFFVLFCISDQEIQIQMFYTLKTIFNLGLLKTLKEAFFPSAPKVISHVLLCCPTVSEANVGNKAGSCTSLAEMHS